MQQNIFKMLDRMRNVQKNKDIKCSLTAAHLLPRVHVFVKEFQVFLLQIDTLH